MRWRGVGRQLGVEVEGGFGSSGGGGFGGKGMGVVLVV